MELRHFFNGQQSKENAASAWLATLLEYDQTFRRGFLDLAPVEPTLDAAQHWTVDVEQMLTDAKGPCDVTLWTGEPSADGTFLFIEDKLAASAKQPGQFLRYYRAAVTDYEAKRVVGLYLGPSAATGEDEVAEVRRHKRFLARSTSGRPDVVAPLGWDENISPIVDLLSGENAWFATSGLKAILDHIRRIASGRGFNPQREVLRGVIQRVIKQLAARFAPVRLSRWPSIGQEAIYTVRAPVTIFLTLTYAEDAEPPYELHGVVVGDWVRLRVGISFALSSSGRKVPALVAKWKELTDVGILTVPDLGDIALVNTKSFGTDQAFEGTAPDLEGLLVRQGSATLEFLRPFMTTGMPAAQ